MEEAKVVIVGAGPAGLATSACLNLLTISNIVLEKEDCYASLWKKRAYDRLKLHLAKQFCELPHMPYPKDAPTFIPKNEFIQYLDEYVRRFDVKPQCSRSVISASHDKNLMKWRIEANNVLSGEVECYVADFLVVTTGENSAAAIPDLPGLRNFGGERMHSSQYENGKRFHNKDVLIVGCGNSGMEIAHDLVNWEARPSIVVCNPVHVLTKELVSLGMAMLKVFPVYVVDSVMVKLKRLLIGDLTALGLPSPSEGPFHIKEVRGRSPVIDVGTVKNIQNGEVQILPPLTQIEENNMIEFVNGKKLRFDAIVFATGYTSTVMRWLEGGETLFNEKGMPRTSFPNHWKGGRGLYCAGFSRRGDSLAFQWMHKT